MGVVTKKGHMIPTELGFPEYTTYFDMQMEFYVVISIFFTGFVIFVLSSSYLHNGSNRSQSPSNHPSHWQSSGAGALEHRDAEQTPTASTRRESSSAFSTPA